MAHTAGTPSSLLSLDDADPAGDLLLVLETAEDGRPTQSSIRVSSKVLSLASPVFAAMLSPRFAEGQALLTSTSPEISSISFPDDNSEAMIWLCKALHFRKDLTVDIEFSLLRELAILCDKYDLVGALNPWSHSWLRQWPGSSGVDDHAELLWISYALGNEDRFWHTSRNLMKLYTADDLAAFQNERSTAVLPDRLFGKCPILNFALNNIHCSHQLTTRRLDCIKNERETMLIELQKTFEDIMAPLLEHKCAAAKEHDRRGDPRACNHLASIGYHFAQLSKSGLWPITQKLRKTSFTTISDGFSIFEVYEDGISGTCFYSDNCDSPRIEIKQLIKETTETAAEKLKGWCLTCVKSGRYTKESPNCRASICQGCKG